MKILLLSDIPPCENYTAGLVLSAMVRFVPRDSICCFAVVNAGLDIRMAAEFANIPMEFHAKPNENWAWLPQRRFIRKASSLAALAGERFTEKTAVRSLIKKAVGFGRRQKVDRVWAVLQGQTTIRMARAVADKLNVPLYTHVWDPFTWWAKANCIDGPTTRRVQALFDDAISSSRCVLAASEPMAELYRERFKVDSVPVISSHSKSMGQMPNLDDTGRGPIVIGMAGQFYAASEWLQLLQAMRSSNWKIAGRSVRIVVMGPQQPPGAIDKHVSFLGWKSQPDAAFVLSQCDLLYCPYPFDQAMKEVSQYSFPSKLVLYLAAGRPIVFHGPAYSSPAHYIESRRCGLIAERLSASAIYNELERLISDPESYRSMALNAQAAFRRDFTLESMERAFDAFIGIPAPDNVQDAQPQDHSLEAGATFVPPQLSDSERHQSAVWLVRAIGKPALAHYAHLRLKLKKLLRRLAFSVPRLRSLYLEVHSLYAMTEALKQQIATLEEEQARLIASIRNNSGEPSRQKSAAEVALASTFIVSPQFISDLYPGTKILTLRHSSASNEDVQVSVPEKRNLRNTVGSITYAQMHSWEVNLSTQQNDDSAHIETSLPHDAVASLLRYVLQEGFMKLVVSDENPGTVALAAAVAGLISQRVTLIRSKPTQDPLNRWTNACSHIDFVDAPPLKQ